jgi:acyl dehydratase
MTNGELARFMREETGKSYTSDWLLIDQELIDRFADTTRDWMFLHVDPEKAAQTEFGGTIAHGFLILSLLAPLRAETSRPRIPGLRMGLNYGFDRIRFISPVRSGKRIRARFTIARLVEEAPGRVREEMEVTVEVEGVERPAVAATWLTVYLL